MDSGDDCSDADVADSSVSSANSALNGKYERLCCGSRPLPVFLSSDEYDGDLCHDWDEATENRGAACTLVGGGGDSESYHYNNAQLVQYDGGCDSGGGTGGGEQKIDKEDARARCTNSRRQTARRPRRARPDSPDCDTGCTEPRSCVGCYTGGPGKEEDWQLPSECLTSEQVQELIREISRDPLLCEQEKNRRRQLIHSHRFQQRRMKEAEQFADVMDRQSAQKSTSKLRDPDTGELMLGCEHYPRNCKLKAACCGLWVVCRRCHDKDCMDHEMNRFETTEIRCMICDVVQPVSERCVNCLTKFARYFCAICKFYDNTPDKDIYHCDKCKICRVGKGIGHDNFHCDRCDACVSKEFSKDHSCLKKSLDADCPICGTYLFTSTDPVVFMRCGHTMHSHCFDAYTAEHYTCPLCQKALTNMRPYYEQIDELMKKEIMPPEHRSKVAEILCHDCGKRSVTQYHFLYLKCEISNCGSYNTRLIRTFKRDEASSSGTGECSIESGGIAPAGAGTTASWGEALCMNGRDAVMSIGQAAVRDSDSSESEYEGGVVEKGEMEE